MHKKLTITIEADVYDGLHRTIGRGRISQFIEDLVRPHVCETDLDEGYRAMASDRGREEEAREWLEGTLMRPIDEER